MNPNADKIHNEMFEKLNSSSYGKSIIDNLFSGTTILSEHVMEYQEEWSPQLAQWSRLHSNRHKQEHTIHFLVVKLSPTNKIESWIQYHGDVGVVIVQMIGNEIRTDSKGFKLNINASPIDSAEEFIIETSVCPSLTYSLEFARAVWNSLAKPLLPSGVHLWKTTSSARRNGENVSVSDLLGIYKAHLDTVSPTVS